MKRFITLDENGLVNAVRYGSRAVADEIESSEGDVGDLRLPDGSFESPVPAETETGTAPAEDYVSQIRSRMAEIQQLLDQLSVPGAVGEGGDEA